MTDSALVWLGLVVIVGGVSSVHLIRTYAAIGELDYRAFAVTFLCCAGFFELGMANGYLPITGSLIVVSGLSSAAALVLVVVAVRKRKTGWSVLRDDPQ